MLLDASRFNITDKNGSDGLLSLRVRTSAEQLCHVMLIHMEVGRRKQSHIARMIKLLCSTAE